MHSCCGKGNEPLVGELVAFVGETVGVSVAEVGDVVVGEAVVGSLVVGATVGDCVGDRVGDLVGDLVGGVGVGGDVIGELVGGLSQQPRCLEASFVRNVANDRH